MPGRCRFGIALVFVVFGSLAHAQAHTADRNENNRIDLSELLRVIQFYNANQFQCAGDTEDGYAPGVGSGNCARHNADYRLFAFQIDLSELLRAVQLFNADGYYSCLGVTPPTEDGFCPGATPPFAVVTDSDAFDVPEGGTRTIAITLSAPPSALTLVSAALTGADSDFSIVSGQSLAFDSSTYNVPQEIVLAAAEDPDAASGTNILRLRTTGIPDRLLALSESDNDTVALVVDPTTLTIDEGDSASLQISLAAAPERPLTVSVARVAGDTDLLAVVGATRTFTAQDFATPQTVTFAALEDDDETDGAATFSVTAPGVDPVSVVIMERDNDREVVILSTASITVDEGFENTFGVRLNVAPAAPRTISVVPQGGDPDLTVSGAFEFVFDGNNYAVEQTVVIAAAEDVDAANGQTIFAIGDGEVGGATLTATERDNDRGNRQSGSYAAVPFGAGDFSFLGFGPEACVLPAAPLTFSGGSAHARTPAHELELGRRVVLPALGTLGAFTAGNSTVYVQIAGEIPSSYALIALNAQGVPVVAECSGVLQPGAQWQFDVPITTDAETLPATGVVYALLPDETNLGTDGNSAQLCSSLLGSVLGDRDAFEDFEDTHAGLIGIGQAGERAAVVVLRGREGENPDDTGAIRAMYNGYSDRMFKTPVGAVDPDGDYVLPYLVSEGGLTSFVHVQNDSMSVANFTLSLTRMDGATEHAASVLLPGARVTLDVGDVFGEGFTGSGIVDSDVPVAVLADILSDSGAVASLRATRLDAPATRLQTPVAYDPAYSHDVYVTNLDTTSAQIIVAFLNEKGETRNVANLSVAAGRTAFARFPPGLLTGSLTRGLVITQTNRGAMSAALVRTQGDGVNDAPLQFEVASMPGAATVYDAANGSATGAKLLFVPVFGQGASALNSVLHISNANDASGQTAYAVYSYDSAGIHEYACGLIRAGNTDRLVVPRAELGDGYTGAFVIAALASNQPGGPGLIATIGNDVARRDVVAPPEPAAPQPDDFVGVATATTASGTGKYGRGANIIHVPELGDSPQMTVQNSGGIETQISVVYLDANGVPVARSQPLASTFVLPSGAVAVLSDDVPAAAASATIFAYAVGVTTLEDLVAEANMNGDSTAYRQLLARVEHTSTGEMLASVTRASSAPVTLSAYLGTGGRYLGVEDPVSRGFAYTLPEVRGGATGEEMTLHIQNAGLAPALLELSLRRAGKAAAPVAAGPLNVEGGDLSRRVGPVPAGGVMTVRLAEVFGTFDSGRLVVRASEPLAVIANGTGDTTAAEAFPVALNYTGNHNSAFAKVSGTVAYAPLLSNPADGARVTFALGDLLDLGTSKTATARVSCFTATGTKVDEEDVVLAPFESRSLTLDARVDVGEFGWAKVELVENPATNPAVIQGTLHVTDSDGSAYAYSLVPQELGNFIEQAIPGVSSLSTLHILNPANVAANVELTFFNGTQGAEGEGDAATTLVMDIDPKSAVVFDVGDADALPPAFLGGVIIRQTLSSTTTPCVVVAATM